MSDESKNYPVYPKYSDQIRSLLKPQQPGRDPEEFKAWLLAASPDELYNEADRLGQTKGPRSEFQLIVRRIEELVTDLNDPIRYKTNLLLAQDAGPMSESKIAYYDAACKAAEKIFGPTSPEALSALFQVADCCSSMRVIAQGEKAAKKLLSKQETVFGPNAPELVDTLLLLAHFIFLKYLKHHSKIVTLWPEQEQLLLRALSIAEANGNAAQADDIVEKLSEIYVEDEVAQYDKAEQMYKRFLRLPAAPRPDQNPNSNFTGFAKTLNKLGKHDELAELKRLFPKLRDYN